MRESPGSRYAPGVATAPLITAPISAPGKGSEITIRGAGHESLRSRSTKPSTTPTSNVDAPSAKPRYRFMICGQSLLDRCALSRNCSHGAKSSLGIDEECQVLPLPAQRGGVMPCTRDYACT